MAYASYKRIAHDLELFNEFTGNSSHATFSEEDGTYRVYSYGTLIAVSNFRTGGFAINSRKYSSTTSRLQNMIRKAWEQYTVTELV